MLRHAAGYATPSSAAPVVCAGLSGDCVRRACAPGVCGVRGEANRLTDAERAERAERAKEEKRAKKKLSAAETRRFVDLVTTNRRREAALAERQAKEAQEAALAVEAAGAEIPGAAQRPHLLVKAMAEAAMPCRLLS